MQIFAKFVLMHLQIYAEFMQIFAEFMQIYANFC